MDQAIRMRTCAFWGVPLLVALDCAAAWALYAGGVPSGGMPWLPATLLGLWWIVSALIRPPVKPCWNGGSARRDALAWRRACAPVCAAAVAALSASAIILFRAILGPVCIQAAGSASVLLGHAAGYAAYRRAHWPLRKRFRFRPGKRGTANDAWWALPIVRPPR